MNNTWVQGLLVAGLALTGTSVACEEDSEPSEGSDFRSIVAGLTGAGTAGSSARSACPRGIRSSPAGGTAGTASTSGTAGDTNSAGSPCLDLRASSPKAQVGECVRIAWTELEPPAERVLGRSPSLVGSFAHPDLETGPGELYFECQVAGTATVSVSCGGRRPGEPAAARRAAAEIEIECEPSPGQDCCPIDEGDWRNGCRQFGGSPPCYTGCRCLAESTRTWLSADANGCQQWTIIEGPRNEPILCHDVEGNIRPDPRAAYGAGEFCLGMDLMDIGCSNEAISHGLGEVLRTAPRPRVAPSNSGICEPTGVWRVTFPARSECEPWCRDTGEDPRDADWILRSPEHLLASTDGCTLQYYHAETHGNGECSARGYRLELTVQGDRAIGTAYAVIGGLCSFAFVTTAVAYRVP